MSTKVQTVVIGAGAIGLAIARLLTRAGREVLLVDKASRIVSGTSSRNSGVVHAGLYYERGSLKASTCVEGSWMMRRFCELYKVPMNSCGKLVVALDKNQDAKLQIVYTRALGLGARDIVLLSGEDARRFEPALSENVVGAIWSPHTATIDPVKFGEALLADCVSEGKDRFVFAAKSTVENIEYKDEEFRIEFGDKSIVTATEVINAAGLYATEITRLIEAVPNNKIPKISYYKGSYFSLRKGLKCPFDRLIYPTRTSGHLGIHLTIDPQGQCRFGPNNEVIQAKLMPQNLEASGLLDVDALQAVQFQEAVANYWPEAPPAEDFEAEYCGIRPKSESGDFIIDQHDIPGYVALYGIDSPGLTASLSLAHRVGDLLGVHGIVTPEMKSSHVFEWEV